MASRQPSVAVAYPNLPPFYNLLKLYIQGWQRATSLSLNRALNHCFWSEAPLAMNVGKQGGAVCMVGSCVSVHWSKNLYPKKFPVISQAKCRNMFATAKKCRNMWHTVEDGFVFLYGTTPKNKSPQNVWVYIEQSPLILRHHLLISYKTGKLKAGSPKNCDWKHRASFLLGKPWLAFGGKVDWNWQQLIFQFIYSI